MLHEHFLDLNMNLENDLASKPSLLNSQIVVRPSKNIKKSEKFFRKFHNDVETSSVKSFSTIESKNKERIQSGSTDIDSNVSRDQSETKLNKSSLIVHNILTNQEYSRASGIPITKKTSSFKTASVKSKDEMSHIDRYSYFNL